MSMEEWDQQTLPLERVKLSQEHKKKAVNLLNGLTAPQKAPMSQNPILTQQRQFLILFKLPILVGDFWSGREDLNLRPSEPHSDTLPDCATPRLIYIKLENFPCPLPSSHPPVKDNEPKKSLNKNKQ
jgi:hypothetical protein